MSDQVETNKTPREKLSDLTVEIRSYVNAQRDKGKRIQNRDLTRFIDAVHDLEKLKSDKEIAKYQYDVRKFPPLSMGQQYTGTKPTKPRTFAEALIWKQGNWKKYLNFYEWCTTDSPADSAHIVNFSFAQHLKNPRLPIFDQHALRALWAISEDMWTPKQVDNCKKYLFKESDGLFVWEDSGKGSTAKKCYKSYKVSINKLIYNTPGNLVKLDELLMPLGKALKDYSKEKDNCHFEQYCGLAQRG